MKEGIHPKYEAATIKCACGNVIETRSTKSNINVEVCSKCHPYFTGKQKLVDTGGRVDRFKSVLAWISNSARTLWGGAAGGGFYRFSAHRFFVVERRKAP